jgi:hypothetical protein
MNMPDFKPLSLMLFPQRDATALSTGDKLCPSLPSSNTFAVCESGDLKIAENQLESYVNCNCGTGKLISRTYSGNNTLCQVATGNGSCSAGTATVIFNGTSEPDHHKYGSCCVFVPN